MEVFLPIAQVFVNPIEILLLSAIVGVLSGLFGVGGGFLMTPFLIFLGVPPAYAVANEANNILATSVSGSTTHYLKNTLDYKMGLLIVIGGSIGTALGIYTFSYFKGIGKIDTVISLAYMYILAIIGTLMLVESLREIDRAKRNIVVKKKLHVHYWIHGLPLRMRFPKSKLYESIFTPIIIGLLVGFIAAIMGIGGAFILVPAMIYIIKMPTKLVPGTDGEKMSKSRDNIINIFLPDKKLRKQIMGIKTDSTPLEDPKNPDTDNVFALYKLMGSEEQIAKMRTNYLGGNYGYGHAKQALYELILGKFETIRNRYRYFMENRSEIDEILDKGAVKARAVASEVLQRTRSKIGY